MRALSRGYYDDQQIESAIRYVFGPDTRLIRDGTYFVVEMMTARVGGGGWSRRRTLFGGDQTKTLATTTCFPLDEPARVRAFFVEPCRARQGVATHLMAACLSRRRRCRLHRMALAATLPGEAFYPLGVRQR